MVGRMTMNIHNVLHIDHGETATYAMHHMVMTCSTVPGQVWTRSGRNVIHLHLLLFRETMAYVVHLMMTTRSSGVQTFKFKFRHDLQWCIITDSEVQIPRKYVLIGIISTGPCYAWAFVLLSCKSKNYFYIVICPLHPAWHKTSLRS